MSSLENQIKSIKAIKALKNLLEKKSEDIKISKQVKHYCCNQLLSIESYQETETSADIIPIRKQDLGAGPEVKKKRPKCSLRISPRCLSLSRVRLL
jgi:hypothetical protein